MKTYKNIKRIVVLMNSLAIGLFATNTLASGRNLCYEVTVTNLTAAQIFTPVVAAVHKKNVNLFQVGLPVNKEMTLLAEGGETNPLVALLESNPSQVGEVAVSEGGPFFPGESVVLELPASRRFGRMSLVSMLAKTNDGFVGLNNVSAQRNLSYLPVYDAGSEVNDEDTNNIPGTGGVGYSEEDGEGFVHIHSGIHGIGNLPHYYELDWRNPAARVSTRLIGCSQDNY